MKSVVEQVSRKFEIHVIFDNDASHKPAKVKAWLAQKPWIDFHCVPTSSSRLNRVECFFAEPSQHRLKRLSGRSG